MFVRVDVWVQSHVVDAKENDEEIVPANTIIVRDQLVHWADR